MLYSSPYMLGIDQYQVSVFEFRHCIKHHEFSLKTTLIQRFQTLHPLTKLRPASQPQAACATSQTMPLLAAHAPVHSCLWPAVAGCT
jgi:hypothetical protein